MKKLLSVLLPIIILVTMAGCGSSDDSSAAAEKNRRTTAAPKNSLYVDGNKLYDSNGKEFVMRGVNHAYTWFKDETNDALDAIAKTGSNAVRIVLADGDQWDKDDINAIKSLIKRCTELEMITIVEVHDATGKDDPEYLVRAVDYWIEMKDALIGQEQYVILNIANEWYGNWSSSLWGAVYKEQIPRLRDAGIKNVIMVDSAGWGQFAQSVADNGMEVYKSDPLENTMFSIHFYGSAGGSSDKIKSALEGVTNQGLCVCAGEFGYTHTDGDVDEKYLMKYCVEHDIGYLGWSWKGNSGGVEYLDISNDWEGKSLSADWGENLINGKYGIKKNAKKCTVFDK
ncbi:MAG: cellulase family glycosylhydrolase [Ruminococcus sp.]|nr:cellulase family glycosylhydrolase [Ruminococcus sp.]